MKTCNKCNEAKPQFYKRTASKDGLMACCKECADAYSAAYRRDNLTRLRSHQRASRVKLRRLHPEKERAAKVKYYAANSEHLRAANAAYKAANPTVMAAINTRRRARKVGATLKPIPRETWAWLKSQCATFELLTGTPWAIDHIIPLARGGDHCEDNLRPLPARLNWIKGAKLDEEVTSPVWLEYFDGKNCFEQVSLYSPHLQLVTQM